MSISSTLTIFMVLAQENDVPVLNQELVETKNRAKRDWILDLHSAGDQKHEKNES